DLLADRAGLLFRVPGRGDRDFWGLRIARIGEERLAEPALIVRDEVRGGAEDMAGRAVVPFQPDHGRAGKVLFETENVVDLGAVPAVDRLVVVADATDVAVPLGEQP